MNWRDILKAKSEEQEELDDWTEEDWGTQKEHKAKKKGKTPKKTKTRGRYMPRRTFEETSQGTLNYQDRKKREGLKSGKTVTPTGKKFSQKRSRGRGFTGDLK